MEKEIDFSNGIRGKFYRENSMILYLYRAGVAEQMNISIKKEEFENFRGLYQN